MVEAENSSSLFYLLAAGTPFLKGCNGSSGRINEAILVEKGCNGSSGRINEAIVAELFLLYT